MSDYEIEILIKGIIDLLKLILGIQAIVFFAWLIQLIANLTIIIQLPKIKKYQKRIFQKLYNFENERSIDYKIEEMENEEEQERKNRRIEILKTLYKTDNKKETEKSEEKNNQTNLKEIIEYAILGILIGIIIILVISIFYK